MLNDIQDMSYMFYECNRLLSVSYLVNKVDSCNENMTRGNNSNND